MWNVTYTPEALRALLAMDPVIAKRVRSKILTLARAPMARNNNVKKLIGVEGYRLRVGDWRVIYVLQQQTVTVIIVSVGHRSEVYK